MNKDLNVNITVSKTPLYYVGYVVAWIGERITDVGLWLIVKGVRTKIQ